MPLFLFGKALPEEGNLTLGVDLNAQRCALLGLVPSIIESYDRLKRCGSGSGSTAFGGTATGISGGSGRGGGNEVADLVFLVEWREDVFFAVCDVLVEVYPHMQERQLLDLEVAEYVDMYAVILTIFIS